MCRVLYVVGTQRFVADPDAIDDDLRRYSCIHLSLKSVGEALRSAKDRYKGHQDLSARCHNARRWSGSSQRKCRVLRTAQKISGRNSHPGSVIFTVNAHSYTVAMLCIL
jgi:hypothetical protein